MLFVVTRETSHAADTANIEGPLSSASTNSIPVSVELHLDADPSSVLDDLADLQRRLVAPLTTTPQLLWSAARD
jgi:hypothetical protein